MDFQQLMNLASQNQMKAEKRLPATKKYSTQVSAPKKLAKVRVESETVKKLREEKVKVKDVKDVKEKDDINDHITRRIKEQKEREDARRNKKVEKTYSKVHQDKERSKIRNEKQIERAKERRENIDERNLTPKMREKLKEERLREKLREIKLKDKQEIQLTTEGMTAAESKKEGFKIPKSASDGPKSSSVPSEKSVRSSSALVSAGARPLYKINVSNQSENSSKPATKKPVTKGPPPLDFNSLMKLASQKASGPKAASSSSSAANPNFKNLSNRPMTQEEKERHQRMSSKQFKEWYKYGTSPEREESPPPEKPKKDGKSGGDKVRKKESMDNNHKKDKRTSDYSSSSSEKKRPDSSMNGDSKKKSSSNTKSEDALADKYKLLEQKYKALEEKLKQQQSMKEKNQKSSGQKSSSSSSSSKHNSQNKSSKNSSKYASENDNLLICRPADREPEKPKSAWDRIYDQIQKDTPMKKPVKRKRVIDSEEEEEEEMADFIDDEPLEDEYSSNYSKCIREIFGYDRRRFQYYEEDDDDDMETSYAQQMKEEIRSTKLGILEDLEDIRLEKEQNKKKKAKLK